MTTHVVTARVSETLLNELDQLAVARERSRAWLVAKAVERYVREELVDDAFLQQGEGDFARGDILEHDEFIAELRAEFGRRDAA